MESVKTLYRIICYSLLIIQVGFLVVFVYKETHPNIKLYFSHEGDFAPIAGNYFGTLKLPFFTTIVLMIACAVLTPFLLISEKQRRVRDYRDVVLGLFVFTLSIVLLIIDPFGIFAWFTT